MYIMESSISFLSYSLYVCLHLEFMSMGVCVCMCGWKNKWLFTENFLIYDIFYSYLIAYKNNIHSVSSSRSSSFALLVSVTIFFPLPCFIITGIFTLQRSNFVVLFSVKCSFLDEDLKLFFFFFKIVIPVNDANIFTSSTLVHACGFRYHILLA